MNLLWDDGFALLWDDSAALLWNNAYVHQPCASISRGADSIGGI